MYINTSTHAGHKVTNDYSDIKTMRHL